MEERKVPKKRTNVSPARQEAFGKVGVDGSPARREALGTDEWGVRILGKLVSSEER